MYLYVCFPWNKNNSDFSMSWLPFLHTYYLPVNYRFKKRQYLVLLFIFLRLTWIPHWNQFFIDADRCIFKIFDRIRKSETVTAALKTTFIRSSRKPNAMRFDQGGEFKSSVKKYITLLYFDTFSFDAKPPSHWASMPDTITLFLLKFLLAGLWTLYVSILAKIRLTLPRPILAMRFDQGGEFKSSVKKYITKLSIAVF
jgi:hypothetical protein